MSAASAFPVIFEFLDSTHRDIMEQLHQLRVVIDSIDSRGLNITDRERARHVLRYFNTEARQHHIDEEKHIFPALLSNPTPEIVQITERLIQDHGWLEENWLQIAPTLEDATNGQHWFDPPALRHAMEVFDALYLDHILLEESIAYPEAKKRLQAHHTASMGREMAQRRSQKWREVQRLN